MIEQPSATPAPTPAGADQTNQVIGDYRVVKLLGQGGMGAVYMGRHKNPDYAAQIGEAAIKLIHPQFAQDPNFRKRFIREAGLGVTLQHKNCAGSRAHRYARTPWFCHAICPWRNPRRYH